MSEVQPRPAASRGRGSGRGGRAGFSSRGGGRTANRSHNANGDTKHETEPTLPAFEDAGEIGELKKQYGSKTGVIKEMFPDWSEVDILFALQETDGDETLAATRIADGSISQWGEVSKQKKDRSRSKLKDTTFTTTTADSVSSGNARPARGGRGGTDGSRGRGRATDRGGRGGRGRSSHPQTNGNRLKENSQLSVPTEESSAWDSSKPSEDAGSWGDSASWDTSAPTAAVATTETAHIAATGGGSTAPAKPSTAPEGTHKTWASMLRQSTAPKAAPKVKEPPVQPTAEAIIEPLPPADPIAAEPEPATVEEPTEEAQEPAPATISGSSHLIVPEVALPPSKDELTEANVEQVEDKSHPPMTETARSEAADSWDPRAAAISATATPLSASQQQHQSSRSSTSGYATSALKATERTTTRTPSYQRRILDQEEAVRMPGNRDQVDRATVQFGAFNLNGPLDDDIDGDREEPETRAQPPDDSPIAPRASLPPIPQSAAHVPDPLPLQKPSSSLVPPTGPTAPSAAPSQPAATNQESRAAAQPTIPPQDARLYSRFGQNGPQEQPPLSQKSFDLFNQAPPASTAQNQYEATYPNQQQSQQAQNPQPGGAFSSAPGEYSSYYTADPQNRGPYSYYNQPFGQQQSSQGPQDGVPSQQRSFSNYNAPQSENLSQYPQSGSQPATSRYGAVSGVVSGVDAQNSGSNTPNIPGAPGQQQQAAAQNQTAQSQSHGQQGQQGQQGQPQDYPYNHPYFASPYYAAYMNYQGGYNQGAYGAPYGKGGPYGQPHQYGISPQGPYGHSSSPASGFGQSSLPSLHRADSGAGGGLGDYGRAGSAQSGVQPGLSGSFGAGVHDSFGRAASSYQSQGAQSFNSQSSQPGNAPSGADDLKPFGDPKTGSGPSPSLGASARPGSATNNAPSHLPPVQSGQGMSAYGSYPSHLQGHGPHGGHSGAGGYGMGTGGQQAHGSGPYGGYGNQGGGGFGGNYHSNQQPRGWGNNYH